MASAAARKAAISKATAKVRSGSGFVRRAASSGTYAPPAPAKATKKASR